LLALAWRSERRIFLLCAYDCRGGRGGHLLLGRVGKVEVEVEVEVVVDIEIEVGQRGSCW